jgi:hypothetical protein
VLPPPVYHVCLLRWPWQELAQLKTRTALEVHAKETEVAELKQQLAQHEADK